MATKATNQPNFGTNLKKLVESSGVRTEVFCNFFRKASHSKALALEQRRSISKATLYNWYQGDAPDFPDIVGLLTYIVYGQNLESMTAADIDPKIVYSLYKDLSALPVDEIINRYSFKVKHKLKHAHFFYALYSNSIAIEHHKSGSPLGVVGRFVIESRNNFNEISGAVVHFVYKDSPAVFRGEWYSNHCHFESRRMFIEFNMSNPNPAGKHDEGGYVGHITAKHADIPPIVGDEGFLGAFYDLKGDRKDYSGHAYIESVSPDQFQNFHSLVDVVGRKLLLRASRQA